MGHKLFCLIPMGDDIKGRDYITAKGLSQLIYILTHTVLKELLINLVNIMKHLVYICLSPVYTDMCMLECVCPITRQSYIIII